MGEVRPAKAKQLLSGISHHPAERRIDLKESHVEPAHRHPGWPIFEDFAEKLFAFPKLPLRPQAPADVPGDAGDAHIQSQAEQDAGRGRSGVSKYSQCHHDDDTGGPKSGEDARSCFPVVHVISGTARFTVVSPFSYLSTLFRDFFKV